MYSPTLFYRAQGTVGEYTHPTNTATFVRIKAPTLTLPREYTGEGTRKFVSLLAVFEYTPYQVQVFNFRLRNRTMKYSNPVANAVSTSANHQAM